MSWYAADALDKAYDRTVDLLMPFDLRKWATIAVIAIFAGGGSGGFNIPYSGSSGQSPGTTGPSTGPSGGGGGVVDGVSTLAQPVTDSGTATAITGAIPAGERTSLVIVAGLLILLVVLGLMAISAAFEFVFYRVLKEQDVRIIAPLQEHFWQGARLFAFRAGIGVLILLGLGAVAGLAMVNPLLAIPFGLIWLIGLIVAIIFLDLTTAFVPLAMLETGEPVIATWKRLYPALKAEWKQVAVFVLLKFVIGIAAGIIAILAALALAIPFGIVLVAVYFAAGMSLVFGVIAALAGLVWAILYTVIINGPVQTYLKYYVLTVYEALDPVDIQAAGSA